MRIVAAVLTLWALQLSAAAQPMYSLDFQGPTIGLLDSNFLIAITEADLLSPSGSWPSGGPGLVPRIRVFGGPAASGPNLGLILYEAAVGHSPGVAGFVDVDALSFGLDHLLKDESPWQAVWSFSVDEFAQGYTSPGPTVASEGLAGSGEASADVFVSFPAGAFPAGPVPPGVVGPPCALSLIDGDGLAPPTTSHPTLPALLGLGLIEPNPPFSSPSSLPDLGDNLDALDVDPPPDGAMFPIYFSLDSAFADPNEFSIPLNTGPCNSGSAAAAGFVGGDVLIVVTSGAAPSVYAMASQLGLDFVDGPDSDDLDALILWENGIPGYQPSTNPTPPYDWGPGGADMLIFSLRRGSALISNGILDTLFNLPIEEGDLLVPAPGGGPGFPAIFVAAEALGLATTRTHGALPADDLDAADVSPDCNSNGIPDALDIVIGLSVDCSGNGVPDDCEAPGGAEIAGTNCTDGLDNDCDLLIDCLDPDCAGDQTCGCGSDLACNDANACTCDRCVLGECNHMATAFADANCSGGGPIDVDDLICLLAGFTNFELCPAADIAPCSGDALVDIDDLIALLDAFVGATPLCGCISAIVSP